VSVEKVFYFFLYLAFVSAFISITVFQASLAIAILLGFYIAWKERVNLFKGLFTIPLLGHISTITLSSILFLRVKEQLRRLAEQDFFSFSYFIGNLVKTERLPQIVSELIQITLITGWILSLKVLYTYYFQHDYKSFWGGNFVVGNLLALPTFGSLYLFFHRKNLLEKIFYILSVLLFLYVSFLPVERSVILGYLIGFFVFGLAYARYFKKWKTFIAVSVAVISLIGIVSYQSPKVKNWIYQINGENKLRVVNTISSGRIEIAKGAIELIEDAIKRGDYLKLLIGWGYGPQKQYKNTPIPFINEYESFVFLTEFINGGLLNLIFILWFYLAAIALTFKAIKIRNEHFWLVLVLISSVWVNLVYHLFTLFWVPVNALFYIMLNFSEKLIKIENN
jgi:hypothetical protein